jgi:hypothetical protein
VVNTLLAYLQDKPFKESAPLIDAIVTDVKTNQKVTENTSTSEKQFLREETDKTL